MDIVDLFKTLSVPGLKATIEYNVDYDRHIVTISIDDLESKTLVSIRDVELSPYIHGYIARDLCQMVQRVTLENRRRVLANAQHE